MAFLDETGLAELWSRVRETTLSADTAALYGLDGTAKADDAFRSIMDYFYAEHGAAGGLEIGSYTGTGGSGSGNRCSITFKNKPILVVVGGTVESYDQHGSMVVVRGQSHSTEGHYTNRVNNLTWSGNTLSWYSSDAAKYQYNNSGQTYYYMAVTRRPDVVTTLRVKATNGKPIPGVTFTGMYAFDGSPAYTNADGIVTGFIHGDDCAISLSGYADIADYSTVLTPVNGVVDATITLTTRNFIRITSSANYKFSGNVSSVDVTAVGGGSGGDAAYYASDAGAVGHGVGGNGGFVTVKTGIVPTAHQVYAAVVGAGGAAGTISYNGGYRHTNGGDGGSSSFLGVSANGATAATSTSARGSGNGMGGYYTSSSSSSYVPPTTGTVAGYTSFTETTIYGGGGAGGQNRYQGSQSSNVAGAGYGGNSWTSSTSATAGADGYGGGGGTTRNNTGTKGGCGCVAFRMHLKTA